MSNDERLVAEEYLGDGVYASFDGYYIWLDMREQNPKIRIGLQPTIMQRLHEYEDKLKWAYGAANEELP